MDLDAGYTVDLQMSNGSYITQNWNGTYMIKLNTSVSKSMNLTVKCNSGNYQMKFVGVDVNQPMDIDFQNKLVCDPTNKMIGMDSGEEVWHEVVYDLGNGWSK